MTRTTLRAIANAALGLGSLTLIAPPADAQTAADKPPVPVQIDLTAKKALEAAAGKSLDAGQIGMLHSVAHQQVVALVCEGFKIDPVRYQREMNLIYYDDKGRQRRISSDKLHDIEKNAMFGFGVAFGAQLAVATLDTKAYCEHAKEEKASSDMPHIIWVK